MSRPITVDDVLELHTSDLGVLERPVLVLVLEGWFDMAGAATRAVDALFDRAHRLTIKAPRPKKTAAFPNSSFYIYKS